MEKRITGLPNPILTQMVHNTTSWVGHFEHDPRTREAGQVFSCPDETDLGGIEIFSDLVHHPGRVLLELYRFDLENQEWGPLLASSEREVGREDDSSWIQFRVDPVHLEKGSQYGFIVSSQEAFVALGEAAWPNDASHPWGKEWSASDVDADGHFYDHFSLAFKLDQEKE
ncbi:MAG: hypothetical protein SFU20_13015 [Chitinophagaceae bacterium]|nr:hypothetical protein [Chitinophagaceae bacterium]